ncbi:hypothetical protein OIU84_022649 [Salix udensis]|uniref:Major facilitator superfamily (MFS) profile domain-containing protein n=1 Tax=Salix udensis TaxID=889485 RepID=A0AAD6PFH9_9ROSI|nr:hypothetical protein OIU84_022649 [Salix udensis]
MVGDGLFLLRGHANVALVGLLVFFFLTPNPRDLGFNSSNGPEERLEAASLVTCKVREEGYCPTNWGCWKYWVFRSLEDIPKMVPFAFSLFFMKVVSSTFMYWLPFYLSREGTYGALATVTAIIDGTGSIGAALGPFLTGLFLPTEGWNILMNIANNF